MDLILFEQFWFVFLKIIFYNNRITNIINKTKKFARIPMQLEMNNTLCFSTLLWISKRHWKSIVNIIYEFPLIFRKKWLNIVEIWVKYLKIGRIGERYFWKRRWKGCWEDTEFGNERWKSLLMGQLLILFGLLHLYSRAFWWLFNIVMCWFFYEYYRVRKKEGHNNWNT